MDPVKVVWGTNVRKALTSLFALVAAGAGAVAAVPPAWTAMGLPEVASKGHVQTVVQKEVIEKRVVPLEDDAKQIHLAQHETSNAIDRLYHSQLRFYKSQLEDHLYQAQQDAAAATSPTIQQRIRDLREQINEVTSKLNAPHNN